MNNRATNIAIGTVVIVILTWWLITGTFSRAVSLPFEQGDNRLSSAGSFGMEVFADFAYLVGVIATTLLSGLWTLIRALISKLQEFLAKPSPQPDSSTQANPLIDMATLKDGLLQVRDPLRQEIELLKERLKALEASSKLSTVSRSRSKKQGANDAQS